MEPTPLAMDVGSLNHWNSRDVQGMEYPKEYYVFLHLFKAFFSISQFSFANFFVEILHIS